MDEDKQIKTLVSLMEMCLNEVLKRSYENGFVAGQKSIEESGMDEQEAENEMR